MTDVNLIKHPEDSDPFTHDGYDTRLNKVPSLIVTGLVVAGALAGFLWAYFAN